LASLADKASGAATAAEASAVAAAAAAQSTAEKLKAEDDRLAQQRKAEEDAKAAADAKAAEDARKADEAQKLAAANAPPTSQEIDAAAPLDPPKCEKYMLYLLNTTSVQFALGRAAISAASAPLIGRLAHVANRCPEAQLEVSGYTDNIGDPAGNKRLSKARADAVAAALTKAGVASGRLSSVGYGMEKPAASNDTEDGRAKNRRIEIHVK